YRGALTVARAISNAEMIATAGGNLVVLALYREKWQEAEMLAREALSLAETIGRQHAIAANHHHLAYALLQLGKATEALPHSMQAVALYRRAAAPELVSASKLLRECQAAVKPAYPRRTLV